MDLKQSNGRFRQLQVEWVEAHKPDLGKLNDGFPTSWDSDIAWFREKGNPLYLCRFARTIEIDAFHLPANAKVVIEWDDEPTYLYFIETSVGLELLAKIKVGNRLAPCRS